MGPRFNKEDSHKLMAKWVIKRGLPLSIGESADFRAFTYSLNHRYKPQDRKTFFSSTIMDMVRETEERVKTEVKDAAYLNLTFDNWTSLRN